ncbi:MAG TPA: bi-domain-containing oxidoreductase [Phycisphaerae bacterium]|nr:bi-domain-containing oxidoreductase [Phycisphaerae bacterium]
MKQVLQNLKTGVIELEELPCPLVRDGHLLIQTRSTLISAGTERMLVELGKGSLLAKARAQPDKVKQVLDKIRTDGLLPTLEAVFSRLDEPLPLGYCNSGVVIEVGKGVEGFSVGDRVANNGAHAEMVCVPRNLCAKISEGVDDDSASFAILGAIGLQGIRLIEPSIGESVVVIGLGLIGLMTVQMLIAGGCKVLGIDPSPARQELARGFGAETAASGEGSDPVSAALAFSDGRGVDGVVITASSRSSDIMHQAAAMCRKRGRIVLVGVVGLELSRTDYYKKELSFQVSCSYGPGRYDADYEEKGRDYPLGFVRWTAQRNFEAVLALMASGKLNVAPLISRRIAHGDAAEAYRTLTDDRAALGIVLTYPQAPPSTQRVVTVTSSARTSAPKGGAVLGLIGAGTFAKRALLPHLKGCPVRLRIVASAGGVSGGHLARKFGFERVTTDYQEVLRDPEVNLVYIATRHHLHARMTLEALAAGKHVTVEKPLCLTLQELAEIAAAHAQSHGQQLFVGFNRRFALPTVKMNELLRSRTQPLCASIMVNAGIVGADAWVQDAEQGGGRIVGEACHFIDLISHLAASPITRVMTTTIGRGPGDSTRDDKATITLTLADGSMGTVHYFGNGDKSYPKETIDVFCEGRVLRLENFRVLRGYGWPGFAKYRLFKINKGFHETAFSITQTVARGGPALMPFDGIVNVMKATFAAVESARTGQPIDLP